MKTKMFLNGKLEIRTLETADQPAKRADVQARLLSPGGELAVLADGKTAIRHLAYVELREGMPRGNHYHKVRHEYLYMIAGETEVHVQDISTGRAEKVLLEVGDLALIHPNVAHAFLPRSSGHALEFAAESFDGADVYRHVLPEK